MPPREGWAPAASLELIQMAGAGVSQLLPSPDLPSHVAVAGLRGLYASEAAEHAILMMLALARDLPSLVDAQRAHRWAQRPVAKIAGRTVVVLGTGAIGSRIAVAARSLALRTIGVCRVPRAIEGFDEVLGLEEVHQALERAEHLVVTLPLTPQTRHVIDRDALARLPRGAFVTHLSRGGVVDETALREALESGAVGGAALDVFEDEPLPESHPWWSAPRTIVTPHLAGLAERYLEGAIEVLLDNVGRLERGEPLVRLVDRQAGY
jgi:phosphoglycerate dehydrogenase-like enzyme